MICAVTLYFFLIALYLVIAGIFYGYFGDSFGSGDKHVYSMCWPITGLCMIGMWIGKAIKNHKGDQK